MRDAGLGLEDALDGAAARVDQEQRLAVLRRDDDTGVVHPPDVVRGAVFAKVDRLDGVAARQR